MRNMSFSLTTPQIKSRSKFVTRRLGWKNLKPGELFQGVEKSQGLKRGEHPVPLGIMRCDANETQPLDSMVRADNRRECVLEGFPEMSPVDFVEMFCVHNDCEQFAPIQRIQFSYVIDKISDNEHLLTAGREIEWRGRDGSRYNSIIIKPLMGACFDCRDKKGSSARGAICLDSITKIFISA